MVFDAAHEGPMNTPDDSWCAETKHGDLFGRSNAAFTWILTASSESPVYSLFHTTLPAWTELCQVTLRWSEDEQRLPPDAP